MACKRDSNHVVLEAVGLQIRSVRCERCGAEDAYRAPRAKTKAALLEFAAQKKRTSSAPKPASRSRKASARTPRTIFAELTDGMDFDTALPYSAKNALNEGDLIRHPIFGIGIVTARTDFQKAKVVFETSERVMVCNRQ
ncbi:MAG: hypothetical protein QNJ97_01005 [Myxococcota bacterium]|nr:hypothetical protein [Myxococcota bacterium]